MMMMVRMTLFLLLLLRVAVDDDGSDQEDYDHADDEVWTRDVRKFGCARPEASWVTVSRREMGVSEN